LQKNLVTREQLLDAMHAWLLDKHTPLGDVLCRLGLLGEDKRADLDQLVLDWLQEGDGASGVVSGTPNTEFLAPPTCDGSSEDFLPIPPPAPAPGVEGATPRFRRLREYAKGGLGEVFVALDRELNREVALKEIQDRYADHPDRRARFLREARITGNLEHPGVVPVYGLGSYPDGRPYYAMRFIRGESMQEAIGRFHGPQARGLQPLGFHSLGRLCPQPRSDPS
jgi:serine/threonine-protein kinase